MHNKFKTLQIDQPSELEKVWNDHDLKNYYCVLLRIKNITSYKEILYFLKQFGQFLLYGNQDHVVYDIIHNENPLHFDGLSTNDKKKIPDRLFFYVDQSPLSNKGNFKILNCESILHDLDNEILKVLRTRKLHYYGYPSMKTPNPDPYDLVFSYKCIWKLDGKEILRMQLPSEDSKYTHLEDKFIFCKASNYRTRFEKMSVTETWNIFKEIYKAINTNNNLMEINFCKGDLLITKNKFTLHGRYGTEKPLARKMFRFQSLNS